MRTTPGRQNTPDYNSDTLQVVTPPHALLIITTFIYGSSKVEVSKKVFLQIPTISTRSIFKGVYHLLVTGNREIHTSQNINYKTFFIHMITKFPDIVIAVLYGSRMIASAPHGIASKLDSKTVIAHLCYN